MTTPDERRVDPLARYWNEVVRGAPATPAESDLDPALASTVRRLQAIGAAPTPDPAFAAKLWENLMQQAQTPPLPGPRLVPDTIGSPTSRAPAVGRAPSPIRRLLAPGRWWPRVEFVAIALLTVGIVAGLVAANGGFPGGLGGFVGQDDDPDGDEPRLSLGSTLNVPPADGAPVEVALLRVAFAADARWETPPVPTIAHVESGTLVVGPAGSPDEESRMREGSGFSTDDASAFRNDQPRPATLLLVLIGPGVRTLDAPEGVTIEDASGGAAETLPAGPALVTVQELRLAPDGGEQIDTGRDGLALIAVEDGTLALSGQAARIELRRAADEGSATATAAVDPRRPPQSVPLAAGDTALLQGGAFLHLGSEGDRSVRALVLTVNPGAAQSQIVTGASESIVDAVYGTPAPQEPGPGAEIGPVGTPTADAEVPAPEACDVVPRSADDLRALAAAGPVATPADPEAPRFRYEDELPQGAPLDAGTLAELTEVEREFAACINAGDWSRNLALLTDDAVRDLLGEEPDAVEEFLAAPPEPLLPDERIGLFPLREARMLPDGRVAAIVDWGQVGFDDNLRDVTESNFHVYERVDGRWLIAEEISTGR